MSEIYGFYKLKEKTQLIDNLLVTEMNVIEYLEMMIDSEINVDYILNLVNRRVAGLNLTYSDLEKEENLEKLLLYHSAILNLNIQDKVETINEDYEYKIDYSFYIAKFMKFYNYKLNEIYELPFSVFNNLLNHIKVIEAEEDFRNSRVVDNHLLLNSESTKSGYFEFKNSLNNTIKSVIECNLTEKGNLNKFRKIFGLNDLKKEVGE